MGFLDPGEDSCKIKSCDNDKEIAGKTVFSNEATSKGNALKGRPDQNWLLKSTFYVSKLVQKINLVCCMLHGFLTHPNLQCYDVF